MRLPGGAGSAVVALLLLNALLTFEHAWPGLGVRPGRTVSPELLAGLATLGAWRAAGGRVGPRGLCALATLGTLLVAVRAVEVTVPAWMGRPVHLYWDGRHLAQVLALASEAASPWRSALAAAGMLAAVLAAAFLAWAAVRWAIGVLAGRHARPARHGATTVLLAVAATTTALAAACVLPRIVPAPARFLLAESTTAAIVRQARLLGTLLSQERTEARLSPSPRFDGDLAALRGADVLVIFAESYGAVTFDRPDQAAALAPSRARLAQALRDASLDVASARVRSPTFGGGSWLAHAALLAGVDTRDPLDHDLLLATRRPTLVRHFAAHGYRTVGWMPGLQRPWPEGAFYGFDRRADADSVGYAGPPFGFWRVPDQAAMALLHAQEIAAPRRAPLFMVFPTLGSHAPFRPLPPYQPDWGRLTGRDAFTAAQLAGALAAPVSWQDPVPAYLESIGYTFEWLAAYLRDHAPPTLLTIVVGDHQPMGTVTGPGASWDVPVHVIGRHPELLRRLRAAGFRQGLEPSPAPLGPMHALTGLLAAAFEGEPAPPPERPAAAQTRVTSPADPAAPHPGGS